MPINPDAVGSKSAPVASSWDSKDCLLYAVGVGAGVDELAFTTENTMDLAQRVLPTQAVVLAPMGPGLENIGDFNPAMLVHGEQAIRLHGEIPVEGNVTTVAEVTNIYDKVKGAVIEITAETSDAESGASLFTNVTTIFIRGEGGWGGERGPSGPKNVAPDRAADHTVSYQTSPDQALIYRLSGDRNPLHSDPAFAAFGGFDRPILHGLCSYGFTGRALLHSLCEGDPARFTGMEGRFSSPVFPGEKLSVNMWVDGNEAVFQTEGDDGRVVIDAGKCTWN